MDSSSPFYRPAPPLAPYVERPVRFLDVRFGNGQLDSVVLEKEDTLVIDALEIRVDCATGPEVISYDRGHHGVVAYRLRHGVAKSRIPADPYSPHYIPLAPYPDLGTPLADTLSAPPPEPLPQ